MKRNAIGINVGTSSILVVFVILCLTTFAALSLVSADADYRLAERSALASTRYYTADAQAEDVLASLDFILRDSYAAASNETEYRRLYTEAAGRLDHAIEFDGTTASYSIDIEDIQRLDVTLSLPYPAGDSFYTRLKWQIVPIKLQGDEDQDSIVLFNPENMEAMFGS